MNRSFCSAVLLSASIAGLGIQAASAQDAAPDVAPPPANCPRPDGGAPVKASKAENAKFQQRIDDYKACVNAYSASTMTKAKALQAQAQASQAQAQDYQKRAQTYADAANQVVDGFNTYIADVNAQSQAAAAPKK